jgi:hypothetical protein
MRKILCLSAVVAALALAGGAYAGDGKAPPLAAAGADGPMSKPAAGKWYWEKVPEEACWGGSRESDADLNEGSRITTEEILRIINPFQS